MPRLIESPVRVAGAGDPPKTIDEYVGQVSDGQRSVSVPAFSFAIVHRDPD